MIYEERTARKASYVSSDGTVAKLPRIPFMTGTFNEAWLQKLIADAPELLLSSDISYDFANLVCVGREVPVGSGENKGYIDNLYVSQSGHVVIVETKLFRNQEARRTVVAQILDYAKELQKWDSEKLDKVACDYSYSETGQACRVIDLLAKKGLITYSEESAFVDSINKSLKTSDFLLMIVGDGIRTGVVQLADFLNENSSMKFNLALEEIEVYQHGEDLIVIPNILTKTSVIERHFGFAHEEEEHKKQYVQKPILSRKEFVERFSENGCFDSDKIIEFVLDMESISGISVGIAPTELTIRYTLDENSSFALFTLSIASNHADIWVMPGRIKSSLEKHGFFPYEADDFLEAYKRYVDTSRCKTAPYENESGFYYADVEYMILNSKEIIKATERFVQNIQ